MFEVYSGYRYSDSIRIRAEQEFLAVCTFQGRRDGDLVLFTVFFTPCSPVLCQFLIFLNLPSSWSTFNESSAYSEWLRSFFSDSARQLGCWNFKSEFLQIPKSSHLSRSEYDQSVFPEKKEVFLWHKRESEVKLAFYMCACFRINEPTWQKQMSLCWKNNSTLVRLSH